MKGTLKIFRPRQVRDMRLGEWAFVEMDDVYFNEKIFAIPWDARIHPSPSKNRFYIKRVGEGWGEEDFFIDISSLDGIAFETSRIVDILVVRERREAFLVIEDYWKEIIVFDPELEEYPEDERELIASLRGLDWSDSFETLESLKRRLEEAVESEDYEKAARLRDLIKKMERGKK